MDTMPTSDQPPARDRGADPAAALAARLRTWFDPFRLILVAIIALAALWLWSVVREEVVAPVDSIITERLCIAHGEELGRSVLAFERSNRFAIQNRTDGFCRFGQGPEGEPPLTLTIEETEPGPLYRAAKIIGIIVQLGIVSIMLRLVVDPVFDVYRYIRAKLR
ncbi:MAG: hypothetical protein AAF547_20710 [Actinomycetota bacterium]